MSVHDEVVLGQLLILGTVGRVADENVDAMAQFLVSICNEKYSSAAGHIEASLPVHGFFSPALGLGSFELGSSSSVLSSS
jgi:hypothetical protein